MSAAKELERQRVMAALSALDARYIEESSAGIIKRVLSLPEYVSAERVFAYWPVGREVDTRELIARAAADGKKAALPCARRGGSMVFAEYAGELSPGIFGIPEPPLSDGAHILAPEAGDLMAVPALCADMRGHRLGHGGGYYDRYLAARPCFAVCLCREALLCENLPAEWNDVPVSAVITEKRVLRP